MSTEQKDLLIIEDDLVTQTFLKSVAEQSGHIVHAYSDAESGWDFFCKESPRLIILDWNLPGISGIDFCKKIRNSPIGKYVSILIISMRKDADDFEVALKSGASYFLSKPIDEKFFKAWLSFAGKSILDLADLEQLDTKVNSYRQELEDVNEQLEYSISRANQMAMEAEKAYVEINQIFKTVAGGVLLVDTDFNIIRHNDNFLKMFDIEGEDPLNQKCSKFIHSSLCGTENCPLTCAKNGEEFIERQISKTNKDNLQQHFSLNITPFKGLVGEFQGIVIHISDITKKVEAEEALKESEAKYKELSIVDGLTGLFNKRHFIDNLTKELNRAHRYGQPLSLIIMDIDNFKHHNDTYGHAEGDKVLSRLGEIIPECLRSNDVAFRYGGEEFTVLLPSTEGQGATVVAERIRKHFFEEVFYPNEGEPVSKSLSLGVTQVIEGDDLEKLIKRADANLYQAKSEGKNCFILG